jgi:hypothetical protein
MTAAVAPPRAQNALEVCRQYEPSKDARLLLRKKQTSKQFFDLLIERELPADAVEFLARLLTKQEAIWWGCLCAWDAARTTPTPMARASLQAALRWLQEPSEEHRRDAEKAAQQAGAHTSAGAVAQAVVYAAGSLSQPGLPEVASPPDLTAQTIAAAVRLCAAELSSAGEENAYAQLLRFGLEVAAGKNRWN